MNSVLKKSDIHSSKVPSAKYYSLKISKNNMHLMHFIATTIMRTRSDFVTEESKHILMYRKT